MRTLYDKLWDSHIVEIKGDTALLYVDMHYIHEITSPQAFEGLREAGRRVRRPDRTFATMDHNTPTTAEERVCIEDALAKEQLNALAKNCGEFGIRLLDMDDELNGIVHIIGPELGLTRPGQVIVCGDSHTATHGAFGSMAFGMGTTEVEHVLATQCIWQKKLKNLGIKIEGRLRSGVYAKDVILAIIRRYGVDMGTGYAVEFFGETVRNMSMEERMTLCNMAIEGGAKVGMVAPDEVTFEYMRGRRFYLSSEDSEKAEEEWRKLRTDGEDAYDKIIEIDVSDLRPQITWGTNPGMSVSVDESFPGADTGELRNAYAYMGLSPGQKAEDIPVSEVFIGSCTNGRYSDLEEAAKQVKGRKVKDGIKAVVVPGSMTVRRMAEESGIADIFKDAGFEWRLAGCSACLGMNPDVVAPGAHCVSSSNRNFEGRQGAGSRTHLTSPATAAAAAVHGRIIDISEDV